MNREEEIERFRSEKLPEYIKLAEDEPYYKDITHNYFAVECMACPECGMVLPITAFNRDDKICRCCKNKKPLNAYYLKRIKEYQKKLREYEKNAKSTPNDVEP